ncbi:MAG: hypothetical protein N2320_01560 [Candidatus Bipolaricaulota bacterium]|nr:hypothetical protein [Candidatus Bipolaricaulota bacterium]
MSGGLTERIRELLREDPRLALVLGEVLGPPVGARGSPERTGDA